MKRVKLSRLYWTIAFSLCACGAGGIPLCSRISLELAGTPLETLCDFDFCTCHDPYGRVRCVCPNEDPDEELVLRGKGSCSVPPATTSLSVENCKKVTVIKDGFEELRDLQNVRVVNAKEVDVEPHALHSDGPPRTVHFVNSTLPDVGSFTFTGNIHSVLFDNCYLGVVRAFAFSSIVGADSIAFRETNVANVEAQAFKKFTLNKFLLVESQFNVIPSRFVVDVKVESVFKMDSVFVDAIRTLGFKIYNPKKVILVNSMINHLQGEAFKILSRGDVVVEGNVINSVENEAFRGMTADKTVVQTSGRPKFKFDNQTVARLRSKSLYFNRTDFDVLISRLMIDEACTCDGLVLWTEMITIGKKPRGSLESELEPIFCHLDDAKEGNFDYVSGRTFYRDHCNKLTSSIYFFVVIITTTAVSLAVTVLVIVCVLRRRRKWKPVPTSARNGEKSRNGKKGHKIEGKIAPRRELVKPETAKAAMIVPDGRTYKETEFHIIVEKAEPLDEECIPYAVVRDRSRTQVN